MSDSDDILRRLAAIEKKIDILNQKVLTQKLCEAPNTCVFLSKEIHRQDEEIRESTKKIIRLEKWQARMTGVGVVLVFFITLFGPALRKAFGLE